MTDLKIKELEDEIVRLKGQLNQWDNDDLVRCIGIMTAGGLRMAGYRVRDPESKLFGPVQFHATYNNMVLAVMGEDTARAFSDFIRNTLGINEVPR